LLYYEQFEVNVEICIHKC